MTMHQLGHCIQLQFSPTGQCPFLRKSHNAFNLLEGFLDKIEQTLQRPQQLKQQPLEEIDLQREEQEE